MHPAELYVERLASRSNDVFGAAPRNGGHFGRRLLHPSSSQIHNNKTAFYNGGPQQGQDRAHGHGNVCLFKRKLILFGGSKTVKISRRLQYKFYVFFVVGYMMIEAATFPSSFLLLD